MKLVIEIDDLRYKWITENPAVYTTELDKAVRNGRPLEDYLFPFNYKKGEKHENT